jgi:hypothetical protein
MSEELKLAASNFGFDSGWVADILTQWGPEVLAVCVEAARNGLSVTLITEIVTKFGPALLQLIVGMWQHQNMAAAPCHKGADCCKHKAALAGDLPVLVGADASLITVLVQQWLPVILQKFGPVIMQALIAAVQSFLQNNQTDVLKAILDAIMNAINNVTPTPTPTPGPNNPTPTPWVVN